MTTVPDAADAADAVDVAVGFARAARAAGVAADPERVQRLVVALGSLDPGVAADVYWAGRLTLCADRDDLSRYNRVFEHYWSGRRPRTERRTSPPPPRLVPTDLLGADDADADEGEDLHEPVASLASRTETLRHKDLATLSAAERDEVARLLAALRLPGEQRRTRRHRRAPTGGVDRAATVRAMLRRGGQDVVPVRRRRRVRPRDVVLLVDVSGSMSPYADGLLRFAHATARRGARATSEVFTVGTRLTRVTRELSHADPDTAMAAVSAAIPDYSGGTMLGENVKTFLDRWGQRGMARGAVVVVLSDGWERGDPQLLASGLHRLRLLAHRLVWANPRKARPGFAPLAGGMAAALPIVDDFCEGHSVAALQRLALLVAGARRHERGGGA